MKTKSLTTTFTQTVPNLDASEAAHYPSIDRNATFPPSNKSPTAIARPVKSYAVIPTPTWGRTSAFTIQASPSSSPANSNPIYTALIQRENHGFGSSQVLLQHVDEARATATTLATCRLKGFASKKFLYLGQYPECTDLADWIPVTPSAKFDPSKFFFEFNGEKYCWTRTRRKEFGAQGWSGKNFKLKRAGLGGCAGGEGDGKGDVLAVYVHLGKWKWKRRDEGRVDWFCDVDELGGEALEVLSLVAVLGLEEEIRQAE